MAHIYGLNETELEVANKAQKIATEISAPASAKVDSEARFPTESVNALQQAGLTGVHLPTEFGGLGQGPHVFAAVAEELAKECGSSAMVYVMHVAASQAFVASRNLADRDDLLRKTAMGKHLSTLAFSERGSRSQFWAPVSQLAKNGDGYVTSALKSWITSAAHADSYVSSGQMPGAKSPMESTLYLVNRTAPGVAKSSLFDGLGLRGNDSAPVEFKDVRIEEGQLLTGHGEGAAMMMEVVLPWFCVGTAAMAHGLCLAAIKATAKQLNAGSFEHTQLQLRDLPNLRARLAQMSMRTEQSRALLGFMLSKLANPDESTPLYVLQSRLSALQTAIDVTDLAMTTCGGAAFSRHLSLERVFRDAHAGWVMAPTVDHLHEFIGRALVGLPLF